MASSTCVRASAISLEAALPGREYCGKPPDHQHDAGRAQRLGFVDGATIVVARLDPVRGIRREHPAAAIARQFEAGVPHRADRAVEADRRDLIAPGIDGVDAVSRAGVDDLSQIALLADGRSVERQPAVIAGEIPHHASMPRVASTAFMRRVASSGLASRTGPYPPAGTVRRDAGSSACSPGRRPW